MYVFTSLNTQEPGKATHKSANEETKSEPEMQEQGNVEEERDHVPEGEEQGQVPEGVFKSAMEASNSEHVCVHMHVFQLLYWVV